MIPRILQRAGFVLALLGLIPAAALGERLAVSPEEARAIARDAYIYGFPLVDSYRIQYSYFVDRASPEYKAPWNQLRSIPRLFTPEDKAVQSPNSDTPYSMIGLDLRAEPIVLTVPPIDAKRYFSIQLVDAYTYNFDYIGSRTTGNGGGRFLVAGPGWKGTVPEGISKVFRSETELALAIYRTQLFNPADLESLKQVQAGYKAEPLSAFLGTAAPAPAPAIDFPAALTPDAQKSAPEFFALLNFVLRFCPTQPSERDLMERFARIGVGPGLPFDVATLSPELKAAIQGGMADAWTEFAQFKAAQLDTGKVGSGDVFGTRAHLNNNYLYRMSAAVLGIYGNSKDEAMYPMYRMDADGQPLDGSHRYTMRFAPGQEPPVNAFWSLTMYELPASLLVANPLNRYLLNSPMLPQLRRDPDGGVTFHVQHESPGPDRENNWLPAPAGPFFVAMRLYWPQAAALDGSWQPPPLQRVP